MSEQTTPVKKEVGHNVVIIYHGGCVDGVAAEQILLGKYPGATTMGCSPQAGPIDMTFMEDRYVILVDITFPNAVMLEINRRALKLLVLDHHATAQRNCDGIQDSSLCIRMDQCGALLAWNWIQAKRYEDHDPVNWIGRAFEFQEISSAPPVIQLIDIRDRWVTGNEKLKKDADALHAIMSQNITEMGTMLTEAIIDLPEMLKRGYDIISRDEFLVKQFIKNKRILKISIGERQYTVATVNAPWFGSEIGNELMQTCPGIDFAYTWYMHSSGGYNISLRSSDEHEDVALIAEKFGGGGHRNAAGCRVDCPTLTDQFTVVEN